MESRLYAIFFPTKIQSFVKPALDILREVSTSISWLGFNLFFDEINILGKVYNIKSVWIRDVTVGHKRDSDIKALVFILDMVDDLAKSVLRALNPL